MYTSLIEISPYTWYSFRLGFWWPMGWASCPRLTWSWWWWMGKSQRWALTPSCWADRVLLLSSCIPTPTRSRRRWRSQWEVRLASSYLNLFHAFMHLSFHIAVSSKLLLLFTLCDLFFKSIPCLVVFFWSVCMCFHLHLFLFVVSPLLALQRREGRQRTKKGNLKVWGCNLCPGHINWIGLPVLHVRIGLIILVWGLKYLRCTLSCFSTSPLHYYWTISYNP